MAAPATKKSDNVRVSAFQVVPAISVSGDCSRPCGTNVDDTFVGGATVEDAGG